MSTHQFLTTWPCEKIPAARFALRVLMDIFGPFPPSRGWWYGDTHDRRVARVRRSHGGAGTDETRPAVGRQQAPRLCV